MESTFDDPNQLVAPFLRAGGIIKGSADLGHVGWNNEEVQRRDRNEDVRGVS